MRIPKYISPTSLSKFEGNREQFYLSYSAPNRPPRYPQTEPMAVGACFDAYVKAYISENLFGEIREGFALKELFELQVEKQHRDWAWDAGDWVFQAYIKSGALADLMLELALAVEEPRFEFKLQNRVSFQEDVEGVEILGKPDLFFKTKDGAHVIFDWKVNGFFSKSGASPKAGFLKIRDGWPEALAPASKSNLSMHKDCLPLLVSGLQINTGTFFERVDVSWANQLTMYGWVLKHPVGEPLIIGIEQIVCKPHSFRQPLVRCASHRGYVSQAYQIELFKRISHMWKVIHSGHILTDLSLEEAKVRQQTLDNQHQAFTDETENDKWFTKTVRKFKR